ncbi:MAG: TrkA family potassium uptake protein, partial [Clostridia bacterium]|nr:TrkA family potassium uptake protein [Clostridia bacterium]
LLRVGADQVVFPETESGIRLAKNLLSSGFIDMISLSKDVSLIEIDVRDEWIGKNLIELNLRKKYGVNIVAVKKGEQVDVNINPEQVLDAETTLIIIANTSKLGKLK